MSDWLNDITGDAPRGRGRPKGSKNKNPSKPRTSAPVALAPAPTLTAEQKRERTLANLARGREIRMAKQAAAKAETVQVTEAPVERTKAQVRRLAREQNRNSLTAQGYVMPTGRPLPWESITGKRIKFTSEVDGSRSNRFYKDVRDFAGLGPGESLLVDDLVILLAMEPYEPPEGMGSQVRMYQDDPHGWYRKLLALMFRDGVIAAA